MIVIQYHWKEQMIIMHIWEISIVDHVESFNSFLKVIIDIIIV